MNHQLLETFTGSATSLSLLRLLLLPIIVVALCQPQALAAGIDHNLRWDAALRQAAVQPELSAQEEFARTSLEHAQQLGADNFRIGRSYAVLGHCLGRQGRFSESRKCLADAIRIMERTLGPSYPDLIGAYAMTGVMSDDFATAKKNLKKAAQIADSIGANDALIDLLFNYRVVLRAYKKSDPEAEARYQSLRKLYPTRKIPNGCWDANHAAAFISIKHHQTEVAEKYTRRMIAYSQPGTAQECLSWIALAQAQFDKKAYAECRKSVDEAVRINQSLNLRHIQIRCLRLMAILAAANRQPEVAERYFREAIIKLSGTVQPDRFLYTLILTEFADFLEAHERSKEAAQYRRQATKIASAPPEAWSSSHSSASSTKTISFPTKYCVGDLYSITSQGKKLIGPAKGRVDVQTDAKLLLHITDPDVSKHHKALKDLKPDELYGVSFVGIKIKQGDLRIIAALNQLQDINLFSTEMHDSNWTYLRIYTQLQALDLTGTFVTSQGVTALQAMPHLRELSLSMTGIDDQCASTLRQLVSLNRLCLARTNIGDKTLEGLESLLALNHLDVSETNITDQGLDHIGQLTNLKHLWLNRCQISAAGIKKLSNLKKLEVLNLSGLDQSVFDTAERCFPIAISMERARKARRADTIPSLN